MKRDEFPVPTHHGSRNPPFLRQAYPKIRTGLHLAKLRTGLEEPSRQTICRDQLVLEHEIFASPLHGLEKPRGLTWDIGEGLFNGIEAGNEFWHGDHVQNQANLRLRVDQTQLPTFLLKLIVIDRKKS